MPKGYPGSNQGICSVEDCDETAKVKGMCRLHYERAANGRPLTMPRRHSYGVEGTTCSAPGCQEKAKAGGLCSKHYQRNRIKGSLAEPIRLSGEERFFALYRTDGPMAKNHPILGPCWVPKADVKGTKGYAVFSEGGRSVLAYRWAYEHWIGPIPEGLELDHFACDNGPGGCSNPYHVRPVTHAENMERADNHNRKKTHCRRGHPYDEENTYVNSMGRRECRTCRRDDGRERMRRRRAEAKAARAEVS